MPHNRTPPTPMVLQSSTLSSSPTHSCFCAPVPFFPGKKVCPPPFELVHLLSEHSQGKTVANGASLIFIVSLHVRLGQTESTHPLVRTCIQTLFHSQTRGCTLTSSPPKLQSRDQSSFPWEMMVKQSVNKDLCNQ